MLEQIPEHDPVVYGHISISVTNLIISSFPLPYSEILLVLDGTTGLNMLPQAREFNEVSVVDELGIPVKFVGVGEGAEDLQPFDAEAFVNAIFP